MDIRKDAYRCISIYQVFALKIELQIVSLELILIEWAIFSLTRNLFLHTAPSGVHPIVGRAVSTREIELKWSKPAQPNGILQPYGVNCYDNTFYSSPKRFQTPDNTTTSIRIKNLRIGAEYQCEVIASTYPGHKQDPEECERKSGLSAPIRTMASGALKCWYFFLSPLINWINPKLSTASRGRIT